MSNYLTNAKVEILLKDKIGPLTSKILKIPLEYANLSQSENENALYELRNIINAKLLPKSGPKRQGQWDQGWDENLNSFLENKNPKSLIPKYFHKFNLVRLNSTFVRPISMNMELTMLRVLQTYLVEKYLNNFSQHKIIEVGCGTGHNLLHLHQNFPHIKLVGLDWVESSQNCIAALNSNLLLSPVIEKGQFNFFEPLYEEVTNWDETSIVTFAALEQTGDKFKTFIDWALHKSPAYVIHIEPERTFLDIDNPIDKLSLDYMEYRGYLDGLFAYICSLESENKVEICEAKRSYMGAFTLDGYSIIVWRPKRK